MRPVCLLMIFLLFPLLHLIIKFKINLLILLKELSIEKALLTLHVMTARHNLLRKKTLKNIMHGLVKMYVMGLYIFFGQQFYSIWHQVE